MIVRQRISEVSECATGPGYTSALTTAAPRLFFRHDLQNFSSFKPPDEAKGAKIDDSPRMSELDSLDLAVFQDS